MQDDSQRRRSIAIFKRQEGEEVKGKGHAESPTAVHEPDA